MWRTRAIVSTLIEEVAGLHDRPAGTDRDGPVPPATTPSRGLELLQAAKRRARLVAGLDWAALLILFAFRDRGQAFLATGPSVEVIFTLGVLAVAAHSGFRLGQLEKLSAVERVCRELWERDPEPGPSD